MKTKIFYGNQYIGSMKVDGRKYSKWQIIKLKIGLYTKRVVLATFLASVGGWVAGGAIAWAYHMRPVTVFAEKIVQVQSSELPPVLQRIAKCESDGSQTAQNGQITYHSNSDGSLDIGRFQINLKYYGATATKLGYDLTNDADNEKMAEWIYANRGTSDWAASSKC